MAIVNDISVLHPKMQTRVVRLHKYLIDAHETGRTQTRFEIYETFRDVRRQRDMIKRKVSKAGPWESAHQFGLAVDFVPYLDGKTAKAWGVLPGWSWDERHDWDFLKIASRLYGLDVPIAWDKAHVQHPKFAQLRTLYENILA